MVNADQVYFINNLDKIVYTENNWNSFAIENLSEASDRKVEGQSILNFISHKQVQKLYKKLFDAVRNNGKSVSLDFRCDLRTLFERKDRIAKALNRT